jgi:hypothetical protein
MLDRLMGLTAAQATALGVIGSVLVNLITNVGVRQQAIREADLLTKLRELKLDDNAELVERVLTERIERWTSRKYRFLVGVANFIFLVLFLPGLVALIVFLLSPSAVTFTMDITGLGRMGSLLAVVAVPVLAFGLYLASSAIARRSAL